MIWVVDHHKSGKRNVAINLNAVVYAFPTVESLHEVGVGPSVGCVMISADDWQRVEKKLDWVR